MISRPARYCHLSGLAANSSGINRAARIGFCGATSLQEEAGTYSGASLASTIQDIKDLYDVLADPCVSGLDKGKALGMFGLSFVNPLDALKDIGNFLGFAADGSKRVASKVLRKRWEATTGQDWPKDPTLGRNQDLAHKRALGDGGTNDVENFEPLLHDEHMRRHMEDGDFRRWGSRSKGIPESEP